MRRIIQFLIFISIFLSLSTLFNIYIFYHISYMLQLPRNIWFWVCLGLSSMSFLFAMFLQLFFKNALTRIIVIISSVWLGGLFIMLFILFGYDILRFIIPINPNLAGVFIIIIVTILVIVGIINAQFVRIRKINLQVNGLGKELKIVHLSDLHLGMIHGKGYLKRITEKVRNLKPDLVLITGDLVDSPMLFRQDSFSSLDELEAPVFFTTGNHEYYAGLDEVLRVLRNTKIRVIRNEKVLLNNIQLVGIDNGGGKDYLKNMLTKIDMDQTKFTILMYHQPVGLEEVNKHGVDLMLAGHTHGGQFFMFILFARLVWKYAKGLYKFKNTYLYTSVGTGTWGPPLRLGTNSEITLLRLME